MAVNAEKSSKMKRKLELTAMWFGRRLLIITIDVPYESEEGNAYDQKEKKTYNVERISWRFNTPRTY